MSLTLDRMELLKMSLPMRIIDGEVMERSTKEEGTILFYENSGFKRGVKTGFIVHP